MNDDSCSKSVKERKRQTVESLSQSYFQKDGIKLKERIVLRRYQQRINKSSRRKRNEKERDVSYDPQSDSIFVSGSRVFRKIFSWWTQDPRTITSVNRRYWKMKDKRKNKRKNFNQETWLLGLDC